jgi:lipopolysaccharide export system permease protein
MSVIIRYILRDLGVTFICGFVALTFLLLVVGLVQVAATRHLPIIYIGQLTPFIFAEMSRVSLPVTLLLAVTIFFSRMSGNNEVVALKALGIPPKAFLLPVFVIAFLASLLAVGINELAVTKGQKGINAIISRSAEDILIGQLEKEGSFETDDKQIKISVQRVVRGADGQRRLIKPTIFLKKENARIEAESAEISINFDTKFLTVTFTDIKIATGSIIMIGQDREVQISLDDIVPLGDDNRPANMGLNKISKEKKKIVGQMEQQRRVIAAHRTFGASMGLVDIWTMPQIENAKEAIRLFQAHYDRLSVEPHRRWATGFSCFFFVWLGAPLAIWMRKADFFSSFFACFIPILLLYYPLLEFGQSQAKNGVFPPSCVWFANVGIALAGLWFLRQIHRY